MTIQWRYEQFGAVGVMAVTGYLGAEALPRFNGATGWILTRATTVILDLSGLHGWSDAGREAVSAAVGQFADQGRTLELAGAPMIDGDADHRQDLGGCIGAPVVHADLAMALEAHGISRQRSTVMQQRRGVLL
ncbi:anti-sigma factor antagonist [Kribbella antibiotica]|uniref:Anti-sigma factor antagonist n=1 Tax=Kribbella antibiotica TaxID=190195 RepID=A0A4R4ZU58_9ACTN|nr:anti-sigma factor antagonist [Kribbella antibiotica]TDD61499.1 anti-sigma factor antagonist [Kribbella antibiotica]